MRRLLELDILETMGGFEVDVTEVALDLVWPWNILVVFLYCHRGIDKSHMYYCNPLAHR